MEFYVFKKSQVINGVFYPAGKRISVEKAKELGLVKEKPNPKETKKVEPAENK